MNLHEYRMLTEQLIAAQALDDEAWEESILIKLDSIWYRQYRFRPLFKMVDKEMAAFINKQQNLRYWALSKYYKLVYTQFAGTHGAYNALYEALYIATRHNKYVSLSTHSSASNKTGWLYGDRHEHWTRG